ncbi:type I restriction-modification system subunit M [Nocardia amikacinitolerans]|uniref:type I restriction-modification system subunit M n=1 Tax=Nocardia amikacinitolerans TaxID=756689 RepID=UPI0020A2C170|nr:class I SAM-dependent DNA methyltransferase [Nocardia amikacinitolerans]MCP2290967.1 type I restriction enzyme M protein [Nocardia amikacinitolerans]
MTDVVGKLWGYAHSLRHDGVDYGDYIEQLTYLLFLKMADEQGIELPAYLDKDPAGRDIQVPCDWPYLRKQSGTDLIDHYTKTLAALGKQHGRLGDIFSGAQNRLTQPATLSRLIKAIDETEWTSLDVDVKAAAFEGLLEKSAAEGKKGAGQYFTPRPLIRTIVRVVQPDPRTHRQFTICDPACGTGGFLVAAYEWLKEQTGGALDRDTAKRVRSATYYGQELVPRPRRLALMNLYLHQVEPHITLGNSIYEAPDSQRFDVVLTNPPFGTRGANQVPVREDFTIETASKQLNFLQHVLTILKPGGRAAVIVPDNVLFEDKAGEVFEILMQDADVHTVLRCPRGTFNPYTAGTKTNVIFFTKGRPTSKLWVYDARANVPSVTKKSRPLTDAHFAEFEQCYGSDPNGHAPRHEAGSADGRWRVFGIDEVKARDYKIDSFKWLRDDELDDPEALGDPDELLSSAVAELQSALTEITKLQKLLGSEDPK